MTEPSTGGEVLISTVCLAGTLEDKLRAAASAGFTGVELLEYDLVMSPWSADQVAREAAGLGLSIAVYQPFHVETLPAASFAGDLRRAQRKFDLVAELGAHTIVLCSSRTDEGLDDDELAASQLSDLADLAADRGLRLAYEAVPWGRIATHDHAWRIVREAAHPALGMCLDSFHVLSASDDADRISDIDVERIFHVQLADAPRRNMDVREWSLHSRMFPGQGALDVSGFLDRLGSMGYARSIAIEVFNDVYQQEDPRHTAIDAMRAMRVLADGVAARGRTSAAAPGPVAAAPRFTGFAFAELAVDDVSGPLVSRALTTLGFEHRAQHRSKPVQLWQHGDARVLLNSAPDRSITPATASVSAIGVDSPDADASMRRAERLLAPRLVRAREPGEADLNAVAMPGGTALFFCDTDRERTWLNDFDARDETGDRSRPLLGRIDHLSITESVDDFDQSTLFLRAILGLDPKPAFEITAPFGVVRSWSATNPGARVRIALSTTPLRRGDWAPGISSPQILAFSTDDAIACAIAMRERGAPILDIPGNYYDDLDARLSLPADLMTALREHSILYDRDDRGEFLHFFTEMVGSRVCFEVVQRMGGYDGLGDPHTIPLRMAAHRRQRMRTLGTPPLGGLPEHRHDYSLAHLTALSLSPPELVDAAAASGYRYVGLRMTKVTAQEPHYPLAYDPALMRATKTHLAATGIDVLDIELARLTSGDTPRDYLRFLEAGAELGARHVITQMPDADFSRKVDRFAELCQLALPLGLTIDLEFPSWTETPDLDTATRILRAADQPNAGLLIDLLHFTRSRSSLGDLSELPPEWFHYAHVCDAPAAIPSTSAELIHTARFERLFPGEGGLDMQGILGALPSGIPYALEIPRAMLVAQVGGKEHARLAIHAARRHLDAVSVPESL